MGVYLGCVLYLPRDSQWPAYEATSLRPVKVIYLDAECKDIPNPDSHVGETESLAFIAGIDTKTPEDARPLKDIQNKLQISTEMMNKSAISKRHVQTDFQALESKYAMMSNKEKVLLEIPLDGVVLKDRDVTISFWFNVPGSIHTDKRNTTEQEEVHDRHPRQYRHGRTTGAIQKPRIWRIRRKHG